LIGQKVKEELFTIKLNGLIDFIFNKTLKTTIFKMKYFALIICFIITINCFAQSAIKISELDDIYWLKNVQSNGVKLSNKYEGISLAFHTKEKSWLLYGNISSEKIILLNRFNASFYFNPQNFKTLEYKDGKIFCCSSVDQKAELRCGVFSWQNEQIKFLEETSIDPNPEMLKNANELLKNGKVKEAIEAFDKISYLGSYTNIEKLAIDVLMEAHKQGKILEISRKYKDAKSLIDLSLEMQGFSFLENNKNAEQLNQKFGKSLHGLSVSKFLEIMYDYADWTMNARLYDDYINFSGKLIGWEPKNPQIYLLRGDAFYGKRDKEKYKEAYQKYIDLMVAAKKEKDINPLAKQRAVVK
jgi:hypothetical protein